MKKKEEAQIIYPENNGDNWIKFKTPLLTRLLPDKTDSGKEWESGKIKYVFYEFQNIKGRSLNLYLAFHPKYIPEEKRENSNVFFECSDRKNVSMNQDPAFPFRIQCNGFSEDLSEEDTHVLLDEMYAEMEKYEQRVRDWLDCQNRRRL